MAKSVLELAVGTGQWNAGLKKAKSALDSFTQSQGGIQQALAKDSDSMQRFVRMMGQAESTAKTAKGQMNDYKSTIEQLTMQYNRMTEAQKKTVGKDYLTAIDQMKQKYQAVGREIQQMNQSLSQNKTSDGGGMFGGGNLSGMLQVFGGNVMTKIAGMGVGLAAEMKDMVMQGIELAKQGEGIRIAFERLGRGDILDGLREATHGTVTDLELMKAAVKFNDFKLPLDQLATMLAFAQQKAKDTGQSVDYMVDSIVTGLGRKSLMILDNLGLSAAEIKEKMKETGDMTKAVGAIIREQMSKAGDYVETAADRAKKANVELQNKMEELGRKFAPVEEASSQLWTSMKIGILDVIGGPLATMLNQLTEAGRRLNQLRRGEAQYENQGGSSKVDRMIGQLGSGKGQNTLNTYKKQVAEFDRLINKKKTQIASFGTPKDGVEQANKQKLQDELAGLQRMRSEYVRRAQELHSKSTTKFVEDNNNETKSIDELKKKLAELQAKRKQVAAGSDEAKDLDKQIRNIKADIKLQDPTYFKNGSGSKTEQTETQKNQKRINDLIEEYVKLGDQSTEAARERQVEIQNEIDLLKKRNNLLGIRAEQAQGRLTLGAGDFQKDGLKNVSGIGLNPFDKQMRMKGTLELQLDEKTMKQVDDQILKNLAQDGESVEASWKKAGNAISGISGAISQIENPVAKIAGTIGQAIATIALAYAETLARSKEKKNVWAFIATAAAAMVSMASTISSIHSSTGYAEGGIIKGNHYSGDMIGGQVDGGGLVGLNAQEVVLNRAQSGVLAAQLQNAGGRLNLRGVIRGEDILIIADRSAQRQGKGEMMFWK